MHEVTFSTIDKPKLLSEVIICTFEYIIGLVTWFISLNVPCISIIFLLYAFYILTDISLLLFEWILVNTYLFFSDMIFFIFTADISAWWTWSKHSRSACIFNKWWLLTRRLCCCWLARWGIHYLMAFWLPFLHEQVLHCFFI
jgi:hypothetical protein